MRRLLDWDGATEILSPASKRVVAELLLNTPRNQLLQLELTELVEGDARPVSAFLAAAQGLRRGLMAGGEELDESLPSIQGVDVADALQVVESEASARVADRPWWQRVIQLIEVADW